MQVTEEELKRYEELQVIALDFARRGKTQDLKAMIEAGISVDLSDHKGNSLLMLATYNGKLETTKMLISRNARIDKKNDRGQTPLAGVCFKGNLEIVQALVEAGANIDEDNGLGTTSMFFASMFGHTDIVRYLQKRKKSTLKDKIYITLSKIIRFFRRK